MTIKSCTLNLCFIQNDSTVCNFFKANYKPFNDNLEKINWHVIISSDMPMNEVRENFTDIIYNQFQESIPMC